MFRWALVITVVSRQSPFEAFVKMGVKTFAYAIMCVYVEILAVF